MAALVVPVVGGDVVGAVVVFTGPLLTVVALAGGTAGGGGAARSSRVDQSKIPMLVDGDWTPVDSVVTLVAVGGVVSGVLASHHWTPNEIPVSTNPITTRIIRPDTNLQVQTLFHIEVPAPGEASSARMRATRFANSSGSRRLRSLGPGTGQTSPVSPSTPDKAKTDLTPCQHVEIRTGSGGGNSLGNR